jgi:hypothetical protein
MQRSVGAAGQLAAQQCTASRLRTVSISIRARALSRQRARRLCAVGSGQPLLLPPLPPLPPLHPAPTITTAPAPACLRWRIG